MCVCMQDNLQNLDSPQKTQGIASTFVSNHKNLNEKHPAACEYIAIRSIKIKQKQQILFTIITIDRCYKATHIKEELLGHKVFGEKSTSNLWGIKTR